MKAMLSLRCGLSAGPRNGHQLRRNAGARRRVDETQVDGGSAPVAGDLEHVVFAQGDAAGPDALGALTEARHLTGEGVGGGDDDSLRLRTIELRGGQVELLGGAHIGGLTPQAHEFEDVRELSGPGRHAPGTHRSGALWSSVQ